MALLFLLPILVCGFLYLKIHQKHKHNLSKLEGHHLYFRSALHGFIFTLLGFGLYIFLNNFQLFIDLSNHIRDVIFKAIYSIDVKKIDLNSTNIKSVEQYRGLTTLNFYHMLIWTTFLSIILIHIFVYVSFFIRILYEWSIQWMKLLWNNIILTIFAFTLTFLKTYTYFCYLLSAWILNLIFGKKNVFKITTNEVDSEVNKLPNGKSVNKLKINVQPRKSFISIWKSWSYGLVSITDEIKDPLDQLLYTSIQSHQLNNLLEENHFFEDKAKAVMLTMDDRKVYIGIVIGFGFDKDAFSIKNSTFRLLPLQSGYRDKDSLQVITTTNYVQTIKNLTELKAIELVLRKENIISASLFNLERFTKFQDVQTQNLVDKEK